MKQNSGALQIQFLIKGEAYPNVFSSSSNNNFSTTNKV